MNDIEELTEKNFPPLKNPCAIIAQYKLAIYLTGLLRPDILE